MEATRLREKALPRGHQLRAEGSGWASEAETLPTAGTWLHAEGHVPCSAFPVTLPQTGRLTS